MTEEIDWLKPENRFKATPMDLLTSRTSYSKLGSCHRLLFSLDRRKNSC
jgi:hypothetical protein